MASDPKKKLVQGRHRLLTIHDGARITPTLVRILEVLAEETTELLDARFDEEQSGRQARAKTSTYVLERSDPIMVARADGLAIYIDSERRLA